MPPVLKAPPGDVLAVLPVKWLLTAVMEELAAIAPPPYVPSPWAVLLRNCELVTHTALPEESPPPLACARLFWNRLSRICVAPKPSAPPPHVPAELLM